MASPCQSPPTPSRVEQRPLGGGAAGVPAERAVGADHPVARHHDRQRVGARTPYPTARTARGLPAAAATCGVALGVPVADLRQVPQHARRGSRDDSRRSSGTSNARRRPGEVLVELARHRRRAGRARRAPAGSPGRPASPARRRGPRRRRPPAPGPARWRRAAGCRPGCRGCGRRRRAGRRPARRRPAGRGAGRGRSSDAGREEVVHEVSPSVGVEQGPAERGDAVRGRPPGGGLGAADDRGDLAVGQPGDVVVGDGLPLLVGQRGQRLPQLVVGRLRSAGAGRSGSSPTGTARRAPARRTSIALRCAMVTSQASTFASPAGPGRPCSADRNVSDHASSASAGPTHGPADAQHGARRAPSRSARRVSSRPADAARATFREVPLA